MRVMYEIAHSLLAVCFSSGVHACYTDYIWLAFATLSHENHGIAPITSETLNNPL